MAACSFTLAHTHTPGYLFPVVRDAVRDAGGRMAGNAKRGQLEVPSPAGRIEGAYESRGRSLQVTITDKPFLVPCAAIQSQMAQLLAAVPPEVIDAPPDVEPTRPRPSSPQPSPRPPPTGPDWLWDEEQRRATGVHPEESFDPEVITPRQPTTPWGLYAVGAIALAGGVFWWHSRRA